MPLERGLPVCPNVENWGNIAIILKSIYSATSENLHYNGCEKQEIKCPAKETIIAMLRLYSAPSGERNESCRSTVK